ncbi:MAG: bacteriophage holin, partial [Rhodomicrobiaceae bacterium]
RSIMNKCQPVALGVAIGVLWAAYVFLAGIVAMFGWGTALVETLASLYLGYGASIIGAIIGAIWAFVDGLIAGVVIAWIYNMVAKD